jgi:FAD/FMN-containing dehydrogenase
MEMTSLDPKSPAVRVQTGASLESLLTFLEVLGFGLAGHPAPGDLTIGGILAVGGHGTGLHTGSFSDLVLALKAVVWNEGQGAFEVRTFERTDPETRALLVNLGRIFITEVTLRVLPQSNLRCVSRVDIPATELFSADADAAARTLAGKEFEISSKNYFSYIKKHSF